MVRAVTTWKALLLALVLAAPLASAAAQKAAENATFSAPEEASEGAPEGAAGGAESSRPLKGASPGASAAAAAASAAASAAAGEQKRNASGSGSGSGGPGVVREVDTVGVVGTEQAAGGFSFAPRAPKPSDVEVAVGNASFARLFEELLTGHAIPGAVDIVAGQTGVIQDGTLSGILIKQASIKETIMLSDSAKDQVIIKVPEIACSLSAKYDVRFTTLAIPEQGTMNISLGGGGLRLALPASGAGAGSCHFDAALRMQIHSTSPAVDSIGGDGVDSALRSMAVAINDNLLSLQDRMLHTIEGSLCSALLASLGGESQVQLPMAAAEDVLLPEWQAALAKVGLSPAALAAALLLCGGGWCLGACCCGACSRRRHLAREAETIPLKSSEDDFEYAASKRGPKSLLSSLTCCRRSGPPGWKPQDSPV